MGGANAVSSPLVNNLVSEMVVFVMWRQQVNSELRGLWFLRFKAIFKTFYILLF